MRLRSRTARCHFPRGGACPGDAACRRARTQPAQVLLLANGRSSPFGFRTRVHAEALSDRSISFSVAVRSLSLNLAQPLWLSGDSLPRMLVKLLPLVSDEPSELATTSRDADAMLARPISVRGSLRARFGEQRRAQGRPTSRDESCPGLGRLLATGWFSGMQAARSQASKELEGLIET